MQEARAPLHRVQAHPGGKLRAVACVSSALKSGKVLAVGQPCNPCNPYPLLSTMLDSGCWGQRRRCPGSSRQGLLTAGQNAIREQQVR
eukprot:1137431-Pelagomonas_calceolata.AAC.4